MVDKPAEVQTAPSQLFTAALPVPDPTARTLEQSAAAIAAAKEVLEVRIDGLENELKRQAEGLEARQPAIIAEVTHLRQLMEEKFRGVAEQFAGRDTALAAALLAQKTSVEDQNKSNALATSKSETAFTKQIDSIGELIRTANKASDDKIDDIRARLTLIEGQKSGGQDNTKTIFGIIGAIGGLLGIAIAVIALLARAGP